MKRDNKIIKALIVISLFAILMMNITFASIEEDSAQDIFGDANKKIVADDIFAGNEQNVNAANELMGSNPNTLNDIANETIANNLNNETNFFLYIGILVFFIIILGVFIFFKNKN